jgi:8-amino-7-oxononanoate synthase
MPFTELQNELNERAALGLLRHRRMLQSPQAPHIMVDGKSYLSFCSNDYLGLANHPQLIAALQQGAQQHGVGAGAAHLVSGHNATHHQLENELAAFVSKPAALLFSTGYMANLGVVQALVGKGDTVFADKFNHASLNDAMQLSRATVKRYRHNDMTQLAQLLEQANGHGKDAVPDVESRHARFPDGTTSHSTRMPKDGNQVAGYLSSSPPEGERDRVSLRESHVKCGRKLVITDAVFSMDGDLAPLPELLVLCEQHDAWLLIDDAHGFGVLGEQGRGSLFHFEECAKAPPPPGESLRGGRWGRGWGNSPRIIYMATLGKAAGVFGAFVAAEQVVIDTLINHAHSYVYTTATPPALASALLESLQLIANGDELRGHLQRLILQLRSGLRSLPWSVMPSTTAIQPVLVGGNQAALNLSAGLRERGIWVAAIRPPTVPQGTARLRITLSAAHNATDVTRLTGALHELARG